MASFAFPEFYSYPPYFTIQPNEETQKKQLLLWKQLVLQFCDATRTFELSLDDDKSELFNNKAISRSLNLTGRQLVCQGLVQEDKAIWLGPDKERKRCLITRQPIRMWAATILRVVTDRFTTKTMPIDNLYSGDDVRHTELEGLPFEIVWRALQLLQKDGQVAIFEIDDGAKGVKFV